MSNMLMTVEQAASELKLHSKTVLRHIRQGRLAATRIGKAYRIERAALDAFAGIVSGFSPTERTARTTAIVELDGLGAESAGRLTSFVSAAALGGGSNNPRLHASTAFDPLAGTMKIVVLGDPGDVVRLLELIELQRDLPG
jgi:excisionase family DNA binding protein